MQTCPQCGQKVTEEAEACPHCGARLSSGGSTRRYIGSGAALVAIIVVAAVAHSLLRSSIVRPPTDFLPATTHVAIGLDFRPGSPAMSRMRTSWSQSDIDLLAMRATDLAQELVDWTGIELNLKRDASRWFGGELVAASVGGAESRSLHPRSFVLIARATNCRRARGSLDKAVDPFAREAGWRRSVVRSGDHALILWGAPNAKTALAYTTQGGCLLVATNEAVIEHCLEAAADPSQALVATEEFTRAISPLPSDSLLWCYARTRPLVVTAEEVLPALSEGWRGITRLYRSAPPAGPVRERDRRRLRRPVANTLALTLKPQTTGIHLHARYRRGSRRDTVSTPSLDQLAQLVPREVLAYALVHDPAGWSDALTLARNSWPGRRKAEGKSFPGSAPLDVMGSFLGTDLLPENILVLLLPRGGNAENPALVVAFPTGPSGEGGPVLLPLAALGLRATARVDDTRVCASDEEAIRQCRRALQDPSSRLEHEVKPELGLQAWARPGDLLHGLDWIEEIRAEVTPDLVGAEADLYIEADPRHLLGP